MKLVIVDERCGAVRVRQYGQSQECVLVSSVADPTDENDRLLKNLDKFFYPVDHEYFGWSLAEFSVQRRGRHLKQPDRIREIDASHGEPKQVCAKIMQTTHALERGEVIFVIGCDQSMVDQLSCYCHDSGYSIHSQIYKGDISTLMILPKNYMPSGERIDTCRID